MKKFALLFFALAASALADVSTPVTNPLVPVLLEVKGYLVQAKTQIKEDSVKIDELTLVNSQTTALLNTANDNALKLQKDIQEIGNERDKALWDQGQAELKQKKAEERTEAVKKNFATVLKVEHLLVGLMAVFIVALLAATFKPFLTTLWAAGPMGVAGAILIPIAGYGAIFASIIAILDKVVKFLPIPA
jgi:cell division protein FtsL